MTGVGSASFNDVVNNYCFIMGTFTVDRLHGLQVGVDVPHPGVGPQQGHEPTTYHTYYQWVPFVLFVQGLMFYVPHWLWKVWEGGLFKEVIQDLSIRKYLGSDLRNYVRREEMFQTLSTYVIHQGSEHRSWAYKFFLCEFLNLGVVVATVFFTDWFLGGQFLTYGADVFEVAGLDPENRTDPMSYVFPRMTKCTFRSFGSSGTIQVRDVMCLIATNIINEKIYLFLWVWLILLTCATSVWLVLRVLTIVLPFYRQFLLKLHVREGHRKEVSTFMKRASVSDWFLLISLAKNMEISVFSEFVSHLVAQVAISADTFPVDNCQEKNGSPFSSSVEKKKQEMLER
ncbi:innexin inx2-like isoform X2 [Panulirus ornatus]